jgi:uncharacterized repeat protein (TIGR03803 family)
MVRTHILNCRARSCQLGCAIFAGIVLMLLAATTADAQTFTPLYEFQGGADGGGPNGVISDFAGNLYGTTVGGGQPIYGTAFKLTPSGAKTILYNFTGGTDGREPHGLLVRDSKGNLYGTTQYGGDLNVQCFFTQGCGVVFKISPSGHETVLYSFTGGADGGQPLAGLTMDSTGNLYGTTAGGGNTNCSYYTFVGCGVVFKIDTSGHFTVLYTFTGGPDGAAPESHLTMDSSGSLYSSTTAGGAAGQGVIFKLDSSGTETALLTFHGTNGTEPYGSLAIDAKGDLYGTTYGGGNLNDCSSGFGCGIVFEVKPNGQEPILNVFTDGAGGARPIGGLLRDKKGNLYGTAIEGGSPCNCGVTFQITPTGVENVLYTFTGAVDGDDPDTDLTQDTHGNLYGAAFGGTYGYGVIYKITP